MPEFDPVLTAFKQGPLQFYIGSSYSPLSIRDQMIRACLVVERGLSAGLIGRDRPLLISGAGPAGVSAAMCAVEADVTTVVVEQAGVAFVKQARCATRVVDPSVYDWPARHWRFEDIPNLPLPLWSETAENLVYHWKERWEAFCERHSSRLDVAYTTRIWSTRLTSPPPELEVEYEPLGDNSGGTGKLPNRFGMLLQAQGYIREKVYLQEDHHYRGPQFWETDRFTEPRLGLEGTGDVSVLISGGGDGAVQDLTRIVTGISSARDLYSRLVEEVPRPDLPLAEAHIACFEDDARRRLLWSAGGAADTPLFRQLDRLYEKEIDVLYPNIKAQLSKMIGSRTKDLRITLSLRDGCLTSCYPLNRFLGILILKHFGVALVAQARLEAEPGRYPITVVRNRGISQIAAVPAPVAGPNDPVVPACLYHEQCDRKCYDRLHKVTFDNGNTGIFHVIILRHGVESDAIPVLLPRQHLPYQVGDMTDETLEQRP